MISEFHIPGTEAGDFDHQFSVGIPIDLQARTVALLVKNRPKWQLGKMNGAGGHQKTNESPVGAMRREGLEELGLDLPDSGQWHQFHYERHQSGNRLWFFTANVQDLRTKVKQLTDEQPLVMTLDYFYDEVRAKPGRFVYNLAYLVPMAVAWLENPQHRYLEG